MPKKKSNSKSVGVFNFYLLKTKVGHIIICPKLDIEIKGTTALATLTRFANRLKQVKKEELLKVLGNKNKKLD